MIKITKGNTRTWAALEFPPRMQFEGRNEVDALRRAISYYEDLTIMLKTKLEHTTNE